MSSQHDARTLRELIDAWFEEARCLEAVYPPSQRPRQVVNAIRAKASELEAALEALAAQPSAPFDPLRDKFQCFHCKGTVGQIPFPCPDCGAVDWVAAEALESSPEEGSK